MRPLALAAALLLATAASAATPLAEIRWSPDTSGDYDGTPRNDEDVGTEDATGNVLPVAIGTLPAEADVDGYAVRPDGVQLLSFDTTVVLPGGVTARPADVVRYDGATYAIEFDGAAAGVPDGADVDAVVTDRGALVLSFDVTVHLGGLPVEPEDLVRFDAGGFSLFFDGSAAGVPAGLDLDAADALDCNGHLLLSFDGSGIVGDVPFDDDDVLEVDGNGTWEIVYAGSQRHPAWSAADLDAIQGRPDLGPGPPVVFGQTVVADPDKATFRWTNPDAYEAVRGSFASSSDIGLYAVDLTLRGTGSSFTDVAMPAPGTGRWYLLRRWGCFQSSWQSTLGAEPGRDSAIP